MKKATTLLLLISVVFWSLGPIPFLTNFAQAAVVEAAVPSEILSLSSTPVKANAVIAVNKVSVSQATGGVTLSSVSTIITDVGSSGLLNTDIASISLRKESGTTVGFQVGEDNLVAGAVANNPTVDGSHIVLTPTTPEAVGVSVQEYYIIITMAASPINGHSMAVSLPINYAVTSAGAIGTQLNATKALTVDTVAPTIASVEQVNPQAVEVTFSEIVDNAAAANASNYTLSGGLSVVDVFQEGPNTYRIVADGDVIIGTTTLTVVNINDLAGNANTSTGAQNVTAQIKVVISELSAEMSSASAEFVELYNAGATDVILTGWVLQYDELVADGWDTLVTIPTATIPAYGYYLLSPDATVLGVSRDASFTAGLPLVGGHVRLMNGSTEIDKLGWGTADSAEGTAKTAHSAGESLERKAFGSSLAVDMATGGMDADMGNGWDTNDNNFDFITRTTPDPQNSASTIEQPDMTGYEGAAAGGPMINHMPLNIVPSGSDLIVTAQMGDPVTPIDQIIAELHYMIGDTTPSNNVVGDYTTALGTHQSNGYFQFTIPQVIIDNASTISNGLYYYLKVVTNGGTAFMSQDPAVDAAKVESAVAQNPFVVAVEDSTTWTKYNITGTIDDGSTGISGAMIVLEGTAYSTTTAANGTFTLSNVKTGIYNLIVMKDGYYDGSFMDLFLGANFDIGTMSLSQGTGGGMTGDNTKPIVLWTGPPDGMFGVPPADDNFVVFIGFSKDLDSTTFVANNVYLSTDDSQPVTPLSAGVVYDNDPNSRNTMYPPDQYLGIVSAPTGGFTANTTYYLIMTGNVRDAAGNALQGNRQDGGHVISFTAGGDFTGGGAFDPNVQGAWNDFGTGAMMPPYVMGVTPNDGSMAIVPNIKVNITFSDSMNSGSVTTSGNIKLYRIDITNDIESTTLVGTTTIMDTSQTIATLTPTNNLTAGRYRVVISGALQNASGIYMGDPSQSQNTANYDFYYSHFEVGAGVAVDSTPPTILGSWPSDNNTGIAVNPGLLTVQFSEGMAPSSINSTTVKLLRGSSNINGTVEYSNMSQSVSFTPSVVLATSTIYTFTVTTGVTDAVGNALAIDYQASFTTDSTGDTTAPEIMFASGDEYGVAITFSEAMNSANITDTTNWAKSVLNKANYVMKYGAPASVVVSGTLIDLSSAQFNYDGQTNTVMIENLGLAFSDGSAGNDFYIDMTPANVSGSGVADLSGNPLANNVTFQTPMQSSLDTSGMLGPMMGGGMGGSMGPDMANMGMMMAGVFPMNSMAGQTTIYFVDIPTTSVIPIGGSIVLTFPTGFDVTNAKKDPYSSVNDDINEWNAGTVAFASVVETSGGANNDGVTVNSSARTVTITTAGAATQANDFLHLDIAGIVNSSIPRGFETSGYTVDMKTMDASGSLIESISGMPFFITEAGDSSLTGNITGIQGLDVDGSGDTVTVFLGSPMTGPMEAIANITGDGSGSYSFSGLMPGQYMIFTDPVVTLDSHDYEGMPMPEPITIASGANTKNIALTKAGTGSVATITVNITGSFGADDIDVFASSPTGFKVKTLNSAGDNPSATLYLPDGNWMVGFGPAMPKGPMAGPPPMPDWTPPMPIDVAISNSGSNVREASGTADDGTIVFTLSSANINIVGTVKDDSNTAIADVEVFAYQPNGTAMGTHTKTDTNGLFTLKIAETGIYSVGVFKPGLPSVPDKTVEVRTNTGATDGNATADIWVDNSLITAGSPFIFTLNKPGRTISGKVTDGTNAVAYAPVWAYQPDSWGSADTTTDSSGNYILYVDDGTWTLNAYIPNYGEAEAQTVVVSGSDVTQNLSPDSSLIYYTITGNVSIGGSIQTFIPIRAVEYNASGVYQGQEYHGMTDSNGDYIISAPAGIYRIDIWTPEYGEVERTDADDYASNPANLNLNSNKTGVDILITAGNLNNVTLSFSNAADYVSNSAFVNVDEVTCVLSGSDYICTPTGFHRSMRIDDISVNNSSMQLEDGDYMFFVDVDGYGGYAPSSSSTAWDSSKYIITIDGTGDLVSFDLPDLNSSLAIVTIAGTVTSGASNIEDAWVWVGNPETGFQKGIQTSANGTYSLAVPVLASGSYMMGAEKPGYMSAQPITVDLTDTTPSDGTADSDHDFSLTASANTISGYLYSDVSGGITDSYDSGEEVPNGWVYAIEVDTGAMAHGPVDGSGLYSINVAANSSWRVYGAADGYIDSQYSVGGAVAVITVTSGDVANKHIKLSVDDTWSNRSRNAQMTPASGGIMDDTGATGTGVRLTVPPNALGSSSSAGSLSASTTASVARTNSATPFGNMGRVITANDNSGQPITTLNDYIDLEIVYYKADVDAEVSAGRLADMSRLKAMQLSYFDSAVNDWVRLSTTRTAYYKTLSSDTEWRTYQGNDSSVSGFEQFIDDALVNGSFTAFEDYKLVFQASTNHLTIFSATTPSDSIAPATPTGLAVTANNSSASLTWTANSEADLLEYQVFRSTSSGFTCDNGTQINSSAVTTNSYTDTTVDSGSYTYYYKITAVDDSANISSCTSAITATYTAGGGPSLFILNQLNGTPSNHKQEQTTEQEQIQEEDITITPEESENVIERVQGRLSSLADMAVDAVKFVSNKLDEILSLIGASRDESMEKERELITNRIHGIDKAVAQVQSAINNFVTYGSPTTLKLGAGERAGVVNSFAAAFYKLPETEDEWSDIMKISNGRWPGAANTEREVWASKVFKQVYLREPDRTNPADDAAVVIIAYGLRPVDRNLDSEKAAINSFKAIFGYHPFDAEDWDTVRAISYSGATR